MEQQLMTPAEFSAQVRRWAAEIKLMAQASLATGTHGSGRLRERMEAFVDSATHLTASMESDGVEVPYKVKFGFDRYGVFRAYGVGRGWVRMGGVLTRGFRARSEREIASKTFSTLARRLMKKGMSTKDVNSHKILADRASNRVRTPAVSALRYCAAAMAMRFCLRVSTDSAGVAIIPAERVLTSINASVPSFSAAMSISPMRVR